jgi:hypothetical protein
MVITELYKSLLGGPKAPAVTPPKPMPDENDPATEMANRRKYAMKRTGGRSSTILDEFGGGGGAGGDYSRDTMGGR